MLAAKHPRQVIALVGLSGAGKSSVGGWLAERLGWPLLDTDALIASATGRTIAQIFASEGEARFRDHETAALRQALAHSPGILATGGGLVLRAANRALLREQALVAWLDAPTEALAARLQAHDQARPLLLENPAARLDALREARAPIYAEIAHVRVETGSRSIAEIAETILAAFDLPFDSSNTAPVLRKNAEYN